MRLNIVLAGLIMGGSLWAGSTICKINGSSVIDPSGCHLNNGVLDASATAGASEQIAGNLLTINVMVYSSAALVGNPGTTMPGDTTPSASASADEAMSFAIPYLSPNNQYQIAFDSLIRGSSFAQTSLPLSGCTGGQDGENCSYTLSGTQLLPFTVTESTTSLWNPDSGDQYGTADVNISIAQTDQAGHPVSFTPEPATASSLWCAGIFAVLLTWRHKKRSSQI